MLSPHIVSCQADINARIYVLLHIVVVCIHNLAPRCRQVKILRRVGARRFDQKSVRHGDRKILGISHVTEQWYQKIRTQNEGLSCAHVIGWIARIRRPSIPAINRLGS
jgi:hypothetical protein